MFRHVLNFVARRDGRGVMGHQIMKQLEGHFFIVEGIDANGTTGGQVVATLFNNDARPQHAGRVVQIKVIGQGDPLL